MTPAPSALLVATRALHLASSLLPLGVFAYTLYAPRGSVPAQRHRRGVLFVCAALSLISGALWLALVAGRAFGLPPGFALAPSQWLAVLNDTRFGGVWRWRAVLLALWAAAGVWRPGSVRGLQAAAVVGAAAAAGYAGTLALVGHAGASGNALRLCGDIAHLLAAGVWIGGLLPLSAVLRGASGEEIETARRSTLAFSSVGVGCVAILLLSGAVNAAPLGLDARSWFDSAYGRLLVAKLAVFVVLLGLAARNRLRLTPRLSSSDAGSATAALRRAIAAELSCAAAIFILVGALGASAPPAG